MIEFNHNRKKIYCKGPLKLKAHTSDPLPESGQAVDLFLTCNIIKEAW